MGGGGYLKEIIALRRSSPLLAARLERLKDDTAVVAVHDEYQSSHRVDGDDLVNRFTCTG